MSRFSWRAWTTDKEVSRQRAAAARRAGKREKEMHPFPADGSPKQQAAHDAGGTLLEFRFTPIESWGENNGCGTATFVVGTNSGTMPCGSLLTVFGQTAPHYCGHCAPQ